MAINESVSDVPAATTDAIAARWWDVPVGAVLAAQNAAATRAAGLRQTAVRPLHRGTRQVADVRGIAHRRAAELAERGAAERLRSRRRAADALEALAEWIATAPLVNRMVDIQLDRVLRPLVGAILDDVLIRLEADPDRIQSLVRGQRDTMVDELVGRLRTGAAAGDAAVDRLTARASRRNAGPAAPPVAASGPP